MIAWLLVAVNISILSLSKKKEEEKEEKEKSKSESLSRSEESTDELLENLDERLAKGEISEETYNKARGRLEKREKEKDKGGIIEEVFYAQPHDKFNIKLDRLEEGTIEKEHLSRYCIADIVAQAIKALKVVDTLKSVSIGEGFTPSPVIVTGESLELNLKDKQYKGFQAAPSHNRYVAIRLKGTENKISQFINTLTNRIDYSPQIMDDWREFTSKTDLSTVDAVKTWKKYLSKEEKEKEETKAGDELTPLMKKFEEETGKNAIWKGDVTKQFQNWKEKQKDFCPECGAELEPDSEFCIQCGYKLEGVRNN